MKSIYKLAVGTVIAGALIELLMKQRDRAGSTDQQGDLADQPEAGSIPTALVADESSVGEGSGDDRVQLPDDGRVPQGSPAV